MLNFTVGPVQSSDRVRAIGADSVQGFLVSRPLPAGQFEERFLGADATGE